MNYVKLSAVQNYVTLDENEYYDLEELSFQALKEMRLAPVFEHTSIVLEVENFRAKLPKDIIKIRYVAHMTQSPTEAEFNALCDNCTSADDKVTCTNCSDTVTELAYHPIALAERQACRIKKQGITYIYDYYAFQNSLYYQNNFQLMQHNRTAFTNSSVCEECQPAMSTCSETYDILPSGDILTSFECGTICIDYFKYSQDKDGDYLIPDDPTLQRAMANYIMWKHWETRYNKNNQGAERKMELFLDRFYTLKRRYQGEVVLSEYDPVLVNQLIYQDVKEARSAKNFNYAKYYISTPW